MKCGIPKPRGVDVGCMGVSVDRKIAIALGKAEDRRTAEREKARDGVWRAKSS